MFFCRSPSTPSAIARARPAQPAEAPRPAAPARARSSGTSHLRCATSPRIANAVIGEYLSLHFDDHSVCFWAFVSDDANDDADAASDGEYRNVRSCWWRSHAQVS